MTVQPTSNRQRVRRTVLLVTLITLWQGVLMAADRAHLVGMSEKDTTAVEYIGVIQQDGADFLAVGYLTHVNGLDQADLFTDPAAPDASTARFTFSGSAGLASRANVGTVTELVVVGTLTIYFNEYGGASFDDAYSFSSGLEIAAFDTRFHNVLSVIAPNEGVSTATADLVQNTANQFDLDGRPFRFGHPQLEQRLTLSGRATRSQADPPVSVTEFAATSGAP